MRSGLRNTRISASKIQDWQNAFSEEFPKLENIDAHFLAVSNLIDEGIVEGLNIHAMDFEIPKYDRDRILEQTDLFYQGLSHIHDEVEDLDIEFSQKIDEYAEMLMLANIEDISAGSSRGVTSSVVSENVQGYSSTLNLKDERNTIDVSSFEDSRFSFLQDHFEQSSRVFEEETMEYASLFSSDDLPDRPTSTVALSQSIETLQKDNSTEQLETPLLHSKVSEFLIYS